MNFTRFLDIQSWWEVPSIAYFCSLFRTAFNLLDFDIEELEEALLTDGTEESASYLLTELIVRLLNGCLGNNEISAFNYQMYLRRLFRQKCQNSSRYNPFNTDIDFQFLPLGAKIEILYALCDFRLDADDVYDLFKNLEAESLRVEPLGWDDKESAYWYFYGTRLYREDIVKKKIPKTKKERKEEKRKKESRKRGWCYGDDWLDDDDTERVWQVVCFTEEDWTHLTDKFKNATSKVEKELYRSLSQNFMPEIPRLFQEKERLQRKRLIELAPRRTSTRVLQKIKQKEEETKNSYDSKDEDSKETPTVARENRARRRNRLRRSKSTPSDSSESSSDQPEMPQKMTRPSRTREKKSKNSSSTHKGEPPPAPIVKTGRKTNNSLAAATGQIVIPDNVEPVNSTRKKLKTSQIFGQTEEDIQTDMYKVLEQLTAHHDAWPFVDPVEEEYAPNYYAVIRRPMDLRKMEERLDSGYYTDFSMFKADFKLIVNNCRLYNGQENEYTTMVDNLQAAFDRLTEKYIHRVSSSDEEIAVEYQLPTPSRKHKIKPSESPQRHKRKKRKTHSVEPMTSSAANKSLQDEVEEEQEEEQEEKREEEKEEEREEEKEEEREEEKEEEREEEKEEEREEQKEEEREEEQEKVLETPKNDEEIEPKEDEKSKKSHRSKHDKVKKKRKGHRHGKHSKNHKKNSHKSHESRKHRKQRHGKNKDKKSKKKKNKHHDIEPPEEIKRTASQESLESSNRSRSASPLPSIHTPSPSPTELDRSEPNEKLPDSDFLKDKYDKIKERRRHAAKDAWESLFDYKQKVEKQKNTSKAPEKDKNHKLRETIEKLKAKNEKYKTSSLFNTLFRPGRSKNTTNYKETSSSKDGEDNSSDDSIESVKVKPKRRKKSSAKNARASEALEQAVKDISKWLSDAPKVPAVISPCPSPAHTISTEDQDNSRQDDESSQGEKPLLSRKDQTRKRPSSREPKIVKRREIQRTIDRLQPGKSKGNLLTNLSNKNVDKTEEVAPLGPAKCTRDSSKGEECSPKLSLGSVLHAVEFTLGSDHSFNNEHAKIDKQKEIKKVIEPKDLQKVDAVVESKPVEKTIPTKKDAEVETDPMTPKPSQEKATPNLSAWFKAFGAPKTTTTTASNPKKKVEETDNDEKTTTTTNNETKTSPKNSTNKFDSPNDLNSPIPDGGDSPLPSVITTPRQRRTSTGSSISERSSFSQDLDSPRHQMSHTSPQLRSPASPRIDDFQKITYPIINGTVRAGFYQDTTSLKSSPEKSCSPRDAAQSPYSPYSQHVYASNSNNGSSTPNYFVDHNKSPLPTYSQSAPPYYDTSKAPVICKPARVHDDYTALGPDSFQQNHYNTSFSPAPSPFPSTHLNYSQPQISPQPELPVSQSASAASILPESKTSLFPVKKRTYNEPENMLTSKKSENKEIISSQTVINDLQKTPQSLNSTQIQPPTSVEEIALILNEQSEILRINSLRIKNITRDYSDRRIIETRDNVSFENEELAHSHKKEIVNQIDLKKSSATKKDNIDMINMGYLNNEDRKVINESQDVEFVSETLPRINLNPQQKGYEIEAIAINLGINNQQLPKPLTKPPIIASNMTPAHSHALDRPHTDISANQTIPLAHHNHYDTLPTGQSMSSFSLNDIELANKKLYACNNPVASAALDYGNWKMNSMRKSDIMPSDYSATSYSSNDDKLKAMDSTTATAINYNKNVQHQQYNNYSSTVSRTSIPRSQDMQQNLPSELRIPNPRGILKCDSMTTNTCNIESDNVTKNMETITKSQKAEKHSQNHPLVSSSLPYKTSYSAHTPLPIDSLRNLPNIPQMLERYSNDERYLPNFNTTSSLYHDKTFQMFNKNIPSESHSASTTVSSLYSQPSIGAMSKDNNVYKAGASIASTQMDAKKNKRKRTTDTKQSSSHIGQSYATPHVATCSSDVLTAAKTTMPASPFNFGTASNMSLSGMYGDNGGFIIEDIRNSTNQLMAANYMAAAVAHQQRSNDTNTEKLVKPAHQNSNHSTSSFPFIGQSQVRAGYPFAGAEQPSPLYQQYWQRYQEELQRQTGAQIMGLYPSAYTTALGVRQPYDSINRPAWL